MDVASDRISSAHVSTLRHVKDMREQRALSEWQSLEAKRRAAAAAEATARKTLAAAEEERTTIEAELYRRLVLSDPLPISEFDRCRLILEKLAAEIELKRKALDEARGAQEKAAIAAAEGRARWAKSSVATHKWGQIETGVRRAEHARAEFVSEIETEDDVALRYGAGPGAQA